MLACWLCCHDLLSTALVARVSSARTSLLNQIQPSDISAELRAIRSISMNCFLNNWRYLCMFKHSPIQVVPGPTRIWSSLPSRDSLHSENRRFWEIKVIWLGASYDKTYSKYSIGFHFSALDDKGKDPVSEKDKSGGLGKSCCSKITHLANSKWIPWLNRNRGSYRCSAAAASDLNP